MNEQTDLGAFLRSATMVKPEHKKKPQAFSYQKPEMSEGRRRATVRLAITDILFAGVQTFVPGHGEKVMHSHGGMDGFWMVLSGRVAFHFADGSSQEFGPREGVCVPRGVQYWFMSIGDQPLEILQVESFHPTIDNRMTTVGATQKDIEDSVSGMVFFDAQLEGSQTR